MLNHYKLKSNVMKRKIMFLIACIYVAANAFGQSTSVSYSKVFEAPKIDGSTFDKVKVSVGGDFAMQFQSLQHHADSLLIPLGGNFNLPSANMNLNADLAPGVKVNLEVYLSARHHNESWVKGGYLLIDQMPFLKSSFVDNIMKKVTLKIGVMELNYGDNHFYRTDNGHAINNPFVGNMIFDEFTTAPAAEIYYRQSGITAMGALTGGNLKPGLGSYDTKNKVWMPYNLGKQLQYYFKLAYDKTINDNIRIRPSVSAIICPHTYGGSLYAGDRAGSRYFLVMNKQSLGTSAAYDITQNVTNGYFTPGSFTKNTGIDFNLYTWLHGIEIYGGYEMAKGQTGLGDLYVRDFNFSSLHFQGLYYFGKEKQFYVGGRYNVVSKDPTKEYTNPSDETIILQAKNDNTISTDRIQICGGWEMTNNIILKAEYVMQNYKNFATYNSATKKWDSTYGEGSAGFKGLMVEASISF
jgi:hypothetical protein